MTDHARVQRVVVGPRKTFVAAADTGKVVELHILLETVLLSLLRCHIIRSSRISDSFVFASAVGAPEGAGYGPSSPAILVLPGVGKGDDT
jgi:hypothetical protein